VLAEVRRRAGRLRLIDQPLQNRLENRDGIFTAKLEIRFEGDAEKRIVEVPMTQHSRIAMHDRGCVTMRVVNVVAVVMRVVRVVMPVRIAAMTMVMIIVVMMNVGMIPPMMPMPGHGCGYSSSASESRP
jgi:hypothetical protein